MPFKILIVDDNIDDPRTTIAQLKQLLEEEGYDVRGLGDAWTAYETVHAFKPDVIVLDINFGAQGISGIEICSTLRADKCDTPIILITTTYIQTEALLEGFAKGADDYVRLPVDKREIRARIRANLPQGVEEFDDYLRIDRESRRVCVRRNGEWHEVILRPLQFRLLRELTDHAGQAVEYWKLADRVWEKDEMAEGAMFKCLCELRALLEPDPRRPIYFETVRGVGYRFNGRTARASRGSERRRAPC